MKIVFSFAFSYLHVPHTELFHRGEHLLFTVKSKVYVCMCCVCVCVHLCRESGGNWLSNGTDASKDTTCLDSALDRLKSRGLTANILHRSP